MNNYTVRVRMVIEAEIDVEAETRDAAEEAAVVDYRRVWDAACVEEIDTKIIEENEEAV
jgi:copper chaperone CopZ